MQLQILSAMNRVNDLAEPLRALLVMTAEAERGGLIASIPRFLQRAPTSARPRCWSTPCSSRT
jgi:hypothetical protein